MRRVLSRLTAVLLACLLAFGLLSSVGAGHSAGAPRSVAPTPAAVELRPGVPTHVALTDGRRVALPVASTDADLVRLLNDLRDRLTAEGMELLGRLTALLPGGVGGPSTGTPTLTVTPPTGIRPGATVSVTGTGYRAGEKLYVTQTVAKPASGYPTVYADAKKVTADARGGFTTAVAVAARFSSVDCTRTACFIASFTAFPKLADRTQDVWAPITLADTRAAPVTSAPAAPVAPVAPVARGNRSGPRVSVARSTGLAAAGDSIVVTGAGFATGGAGVYVGIAQTDQFSVTDQSSFGPGTLWVSRSNGRMRADGSFSVRLPVTARFGRADCVRNRCAVYTFAAHGSPDRSQDTATAVSFVGGTAPRGPVAVPADGGAGRPRPADLRTGPTTAATTLSTSTIAAEGATSITVSGTGFATDGPGVYVGVAETQRFSTTDPSAFGAVAWVQPGQISRDGSFSVTLRVTPVFAAGNCIENTCAVFTFAAHGSSDRSQDTSAAITVAGTAAEKKAATAKAERALAAEKAKKEAAKRSTGANATPSTAADAPTDTAAAERAPAGAPWLWVLGAGVAALVLGGAGYAVGRRGR